jgi:molybdopterin-guanine dinucleotide biosynthesis protein A
MSDGPGRLGAIVLAGGRSSRFGRDKLAEPMPDGRTLLDHAITAVRAFAPDADVVVVAAPDDDPALPPDVRLAHDRAAYGGPLAGMAVGLDALVGIERVVVVAGDMPSLRPAVLRLLDTAIVDGADAAVLEDAGDPRPHVFPFAVRRAAALPVVAAQLARGTRRIGAVAEALAARVIPAASWRSLDPPGDTVRDIDVVHDVARD